MILLTIIVISKGVRLISQEEVERLAYGECSNNNNKKGLSKGVKLATIEYVDYVITGKYDKKKNKNGLTKGEQLASWDYAYNLAEKYNLSFSLQIYFVDLEITENIDM